MKDKHEKHVATPRTNDHRNREGKEIRRGGGRPLDKPPPKRFSTRSAWFVFFLACMVRIFHATVMIHSYFDPDEFWQTMEPAYCLVFYDKPSQPNNNNESTESVHFSCPGFTWEWKRRPEPGVHDTNLIESSMWGPARTHLSVLPVYLFFLLLKYMRWDSTWMVERGPMLLYAVTVAAPTDWMVWYVAHYLKPSSSASSTTTITVSDDDYNDSLPAWCLFCSLSSWFNAYCMVRTFANAQETELIMIGVALVSPELFLQSSSSFATSRRANSGDSSSSNKEPWWKSSQTSLSRACLAFWLGGLCVSIRFTAIAIYVPMGFLLAMNHASSSSSSTMDNKNKPTRPWWQSFVTYLFYPCATFGAAGVFVAMCVDWYFFGIWTLPFLGNFHFNAVLNYASLFGAHPWYWYFVAGIPVVAGLLLPILVVDFVAYAGRLLRRSVSSRGKHYQRDYGRRNLCIMASAYIVILSGNAHKEFRYILPALPIFCLLAGERVRSVFVRMTGGHRGRIVALGTVVVVIQLIVVAYLGRFHQSGSISVNRRIVQHVVENNATQSSPSFSIHYLTGACHSTPLLSQLHIPISSSASSEQQQQQQNVRFETWSLDCSPGCRADPNVICEYQRFDLDPAAFIREAYDSSNDAVAGTEEICEIQEGDEDTMTCKMQQQQEQQGTSPPDYLITTSSYLNRMDQNLLASYGLYKLDRFPQWLRGIRIGGRYKLLDEHGDSFSSTSHSLYTIRSPLPHQQRIALLELSVEDMVVFANKR